MTQTWLSILIGITVLVIALPYVWRIRHPQQKLFAAYLIFVTIFVVSSFVLYRLLVLLVGILELADPLNRLLPAVVFISLIILPASALATWQARKPPWRQGPPP